MRGCACIWVLVAGSPGAVCFCLFGATAPVSITDRSTGIRGNVRARWRVTPYRLALPIGNSAEAWASRLQPLSLKKEATA
jgi:hypothetical protein